MLSAGVSYHNSWTSLSRAVIFVYRLMKIRCDKSKFFAVAASPRAMFNTVLGEMQECASKAVATESGRPLRHIITFNISMCMQVVLAVIKKLMTVMKKRKMKRVKRMMDF